RAVGVEVQRLDALGLQVPARGRVLGDGTGRRDVVGRDRVAQQRQTTGAGDRLDVVDVDGHAFEIGRVLHIGAGLVPLVDFAFRHVQALPAFVAGEHVAVAGHEHVGVQGTADGVVD